MSEKHLLTPLHVMIRKFSFNDTPMPNRKVPKVNLNHSVLPQWSVTIYLRGRYLDVPREQGVTRVAIQALHSSLEIRRYGFQSRGIHVCIDSREPKLLR